MRPNEQLAWPVVVASCLVKACNLVILVHGFYVPATRINVRVPGTFMQNCVKKATSLLGVVNFKMWRGQLFQNVPHTPVNCGHSARVMAVAQEMDGLGVLLAPEFVLATFG